MSNYSLKVKLLTLETHQKDLGNLLINVVEGEEWYWSFPQDG